MKSRALSFSVLLLAAGAAAMGNTPNRAVEKVFDVTGVVRLPLASDGRIVVAHDEIPGVMPPMTMAFPVVDRAEAATLRAGDCVQFRLHLTDSISTATDFAVTGHVATAEKIAIAPHEETARLHEGDTVPEFSLIAENNQPLTADALRGKVTVVTFIFSRCPVPEYCPAMAIRFGELQKTILADPKLARDTRLLSITLDPEFDRPEVLKAYGAAIGADPAVWHFATGDKKAISRLTRLFAVYVEKEGVTLNHTLCTAVIAADGRISSLWRGNGWRADELLGAIAAARP